MENKVFFENGILTTTSANHIANLAKEAASSIEAECVVGDFYSSFITSVNGTHPLCVGEGTTREQMGSVEARLGTIAQLKSLCAWLREAIKAKKKASDDLHDLPFTVIASQLGLQNELSNPQMPVRAVILTEDEYYDALPIKERNRYFQLETQCAVIGKYIHPEGQLATARKELMKKIKAPYARTMMGNTVMIEQYKPTITPQEVDEIFFTLQDRHRSLQAELNGMKHKCELAVQASKETSDSAYALAMEEYKRAKDAFYSREGIITAQCEEWRTKKAAEIAAWKIAIPDSLREVYDYVTKLGK